MKRLANVQSIGTHWVSAGSHPAKLLVADTDVRW